MRDIAISMRKPPSDVVISAYLKERAAELLGKRSAPPKFHNQLELAKAIGISKGWMTAFMQGAVVGPSVQNGMRSVLGMSGDEIEAAAAAWAQMHPEISESKTERPERYPNRAAAATFARLSGVSEAAVKLVEGYDLQSDTDPSPETWLGWMKSEADKAKFGRPSEGRDVSPDETRPTLPNRRK